MGNNKKNGEVLWDLNSILSNYKLVQKLFVF